MTDTDPRTLAEKLKLLADGLAAGSHFPEPIEWKPDSIGILLILEAATYLAALPAERACKNCGERTVPISAERAQAATWQPIETAPDRAIVANCSYGQAHWAELGVRGKGAMRFLWYTPQGKSIPTATHWMPEPSK